MIQTKILEFVDIDVMVMNDILNEELEALQNEGNTIVQLLDGGRACCHEGSTHRGIMVVYQQKPTRKSK